MHRPTVRKFSIFLRFFLVETLFFGKVYALFSAWIGERGYIRQTKWTSGPNHDCSVYTGHMQLPGWCGRLLRVSVERTSALRDGQTECRIADSKRDSVVSGNDDTQTDLGNRSDRHSSLQTWSHGPPTWTADETDKTKWDTRRRHRHSRVCRLGGGVTMTTESNKNDAVTMTCMNLSGYILQCDYINFSWMLTIACCLVVRLGLR